MDYLNITKTLNLCKCKGNLIMNQNGFKEEEREKRELGNNTLNDSNILDSPLIQYRNQLDEIDKNLIRLLSERYSITDLVGEYKREQQIEVLDSERENRLLERVKNLAIENKILVNQEDLNFLVELYESIMRHSRLRQSNNR